jgi:hypothetical protein
MCNLGVGCEEAGVCFADAHQRPEMCGALPDELYRYETNNDVVLLEKFKIIKHTKCGFWIPRNNYTWQIDGKKRFVLASGTKRYAYPTEQEARESFFQRKKRHIAILRARLEDIEAAVQALKENRIADYSSTRYVEFY